MPLLSSNHRRAPETVLAFAKNFVQTMQPDSKSGFVSLSISDSVSLGNDILTKGEDLNLAPLYVVSRGEGQGFLLVAGDNRITPVWGMIERGDYAEGVNPGFDIMIEQLKAEMWAEALAVESLRDSVYENLCAKLGSHGATKAKNPDPDIPPAISPDIPAYNRTETVERYPYFENEYEYGPLLKTKWHQQSPFNNFRTDDAPAGCMAISCGQIMAYHRHPIYMAATGHYYTWDAYQSYGYLFSSDAANNVSTLMQDLGSKPYLHLEYGESTGAHCSHTPRTFEAFGYVINGAHRSANFSDIRNEVNENRPVHICGDDNGVFVKKGHSWVADGALAQSQWVTMCTLFYWNDQLVYTIESKEPSKKSTGFYIHHNFGWGGNYDGWMGMRPLPNNVPNASAFNHNLKIIIGIQPK